MVRELPGFVQVVVSKAGDEIRMEWTRDSAFRFFPLVEHEDLGLTMHPFDLATNKVLALVGRLKVRDWVDVINSHAKLLRDSESDLLYAIRRKADRAAAWLCGPELVRRRQPVRHRRRAAAGQRGSDRRGITSCANSSMPSVLGKSMARTMTYWTPAST